MMAVSRSRFVGKLGCAALSLSKRRLPVHPATSGCSALLAVPASGAGCSALLAGPAVWPSRLARILLPLVMTACLLARILMELNDCAGCSTLPELQFAAHCSPLMAGFRAPPFELRKNVCMTQYTPACSGLIQNGCNGSCIFVYSLIAWSFKVVGQFFPAPQL